MDYTAQYLDTKVKENKMTDKQNALEKAVSTNIKANKEHRLIFEKHYDAILLYSA